MKTDLPSQPKGINPQELRIGNWVEINGVPVQIDGRAIYRLDFYLPEPANNPLPILLTPAILEAAGFERRSETSETRIKAGFFIYAPGATGMGYGFGVKGLGLLISVKYLHQLQNLYFALTGQELEIKLPMSNP